MCPYYITSRTHDACLSRYQWWLIVWLKWYPLDFSIVKVSFSPLLLLRTLLLGDPLRLCKYSVSQWSFVQLFIIHWWFLPESINTMVDVKWCLPVSITASAFVSWHSSVMCFTFPLFTNFSVSKDSWIKGFIYLFIYLVEKKKVNEEQHNNIVSKYIPTNYF